MYLNLSILKIIEGMTHLSSFFSLFFFLYFYLHKNYPGKYKPFWTSPYTSPHSDSVNLGWARLRMLHIYIPAGDSDALGCCPELWATIQEHWRRGLCLTLSHFSSWVLSEILRKFKSISLECFRLEINPLDLFWSSYSCRPNQNELQQGIDYLVIFKSLKYSPPPPRMMVCQGQEFPQAKISKLYQW